jgi:hypothetical protein
MSMEYLEEVARQKKLKGGDREEYEALLDEYEEQNEVFWLWNRLYIIAAGIFFWCMLFAGIVFLLGLEFEFEVPGGLALGMAVLAVIDFPLFMIFMFLGQKHGRELSAREARVLGFLESL